jgi:hypothetical protein
MAEGDGGTAAEFRGVRPHPVPSGPLRMPEARDEEDGLLRPSAVRAGASGARSDGAAGVGAPSGDSRGGGGGEHDDEPAPEAPQSPLSVWLSLLVRLLFSLASTVVTALVFVLYPVYCLIPRFVLEGLFKGLFRVGYLIYLTPVGARRR